MRVVTCTYRASLVRRQYYSSSKQTNTWYVIIGHSRNYFSARGEPPERLCRKEWSSFLNCLSSCYAYRARLFMHSRYGSWDISRGQGPRIRYPRLRYTKLGKLKTMPVWLSRTVLEVAGRLSSCQSQLSDSWVRFPAEMHVESRRAREPHLSDSPPPPRI